jgi:hypothetical protein
MSKIRTRSVEEALESRIAQAIAITPPSDRARIRQLKNVRRISAIDSRIDAFADSLIVHIAALSDELEGARARLSALRATAKTTNRDYGTSLRIAGAAPGTLAEAVVDLLRENAQLQRLHTQDRAILVRQGDALAGVRRHGKRRTPHVPEPPRDGLQAELRSVAARVANLQRVIDQERFHLTCPS